MSLFRKPSSRGKKQRRVVRLTMTDDDDDADSDNCINASRTSAAESHRRELSMKQKKRSMKAKQHSKIRSFGGDDEEEERDKTRKERKSKKKKSRLGFGGGAPTEDVKAGDNEEDGNTSAKSSHHYSVDMLKELQGEQVYSKRRNHQDKNTEKHVETKQENIDSIHETTRREEEDFIPLSSGNVAEQTVLSGEQAFALEEENDGSNALCSIYAKEFGDNKNDSTRFESSIPVPGKISPADDDKEQDKWESQVAQRAGVTDTQPHHHRGSTKSLDAIRQDILSTIKNMENVSEDAQQTRRRRLVDLEQAEVALQRNESEMQEAGVAVEYYQELRSQLADWVGAMRSLVEKLKPVGEVVVSLKSELAGRSQWLAWEDAVVAVLHQHQLLDRVEGRQSALTTATGDPLSHLPTIDEFGRDVKSQATLTREKVFRERQQATKKALLQEQPSDSTVAKPVNDDNSKNGYLVAAESMHTPEQLKMFDERRIALGDAMQVAVDEVDTAFLDLQALVNVFQDWRETHSRDYQQSFASLSLADLASVLIVIDLYRRDNDCSPTWQTIVETSIMSGALCSAGVERLLERSIVPYITSLLSGSAYFLAGNDGQNDQVYKLFSIAATLSDSSPSSPGASKAVVALGKLVSDYLLQSLDDLALPLLVNKSSAQIEGLSSLEWQMSYQYATHTCLDRALRVLVKVFQWAPLLCDNKVWISRVVHFCSGPLLNATLANASESKRSHIIQQVHELIKRLGWMDEYMIELMPLRAAKAAYDE